MSSDVIDTIWRHPFNEKGQDYVFRVDVVYPKDKDEFFRCSLFAGGEKGRLKETFPLPIPEDFDFTDELAVEDHAKVAGAKLIENLRGKLLPKPTTYHIKEDQ